LALISARNGPRCRARGKNAMPPLGGLFQPEEIDALWAYVIAGEKK
jgi:hypothetical protein